MKMWATVGTVLLSTVLGFAGLATVQTVPSDIVVDKGTTFQTIWGWSQIAQMGRGHANYDLWRDECADRLVNEVGITQHVFEVGGKISNTLGIIDWSTVDGRIADTLTPLRNAANATGRPFGVTVRYLHNRPDTLHEDNPNLYAAFNMEVFAHIEGAGFTINRFEAINEPDINGWSNGSMVQNVRELLHRMEGSPFEHIGVTLPDSRSINNAKARAVYMESYADDILDHPFFVALGFHRYTGTPATYWNPFAAVASSHGLGMIQSEMLDYDYHMAYIDLSNGVNEVRQYAGCYYGSQEIGPDDGDQYFIVQNRSTTPWLQKGFRTELLQRYFRYILPGAVRVGVTSGVTNVLPLAFVNPDDGVVVAMKITGEGEYVIGGLDPGTYGVSYAVENSVSGESSDVIVSESGQATVWAPGTGMLTIYERTLVSSPTPQPTETPAPTPTETPTPQPTETPTPTATETPIDTPTPECNCICCGG